MYDSWKGEVGKRLHRLQVLKMNYNILDGIWVANWKGLALKDLVPLIRQRD